MACGKRGGRSWRQANLVEIEDFHASARPAAQDFVADRLVEGDHPERPLRGRVVDRVPRHRPVAGVDTALQRPRRRPRLPHVTKAYSKVGRGVRAQTKTGKMRDGRHHARGGGSRVPNRQVQVEGTVAVGQRRIKVEPEPVGRIDELERQASLLWPTDESARHQPAPTGIDDVASERIIGRLDRPGKRQPERRRHLRRIDVHSERIPRGSGLLQILVVAVEVSQAHEFAGAAVERDADEIVGQSKHVGRIDDASSRLLGGTRCGLLAGSLCQSLGHFTA